MDPTSFHLSSTMSTVKFSRPKGDTDALPAFRYPPLLLRYNCLCLALFLCLSALPLRGINRFSIFFLSAPSPSPFSCPPMQALSSLHSSAPQGALRGVSPIQRQKQAGAQYTRTQLATFLAAPHSLTYIWRHSSSQEPALMLKGRAHFC